MASYKEYECVGCGYTVAANPKGKDMVMMGEVYNYLCPDCKEIVEVLYPYGEKPVLKTDDIHPPKSVISVHFFCLTCLMALQI